MSLDFKRWAVLDTGNQNSHYRIAYIWFVGGLCRIVIQLPVGYARMMREVDKCFLSMAVKVFLLRLTNLLRFSVFFWFAWIGSLCTEMYHSSLQFAKLKVGNSLEGMNHTGTKSIEGNHSTTHEKINAKPMITKNVNKWTTEISAFAHYDVSGLKLVDLLFTSSFFQTIIVARMRRFSGNHLQVCNRFISKEIVTHRQKIT